MSSSSSTLLRLGPEPFFITVGWLVQSSRRPASDLVALSSTAREPYHWAAKYQRPWKVAHMRQFGSIHPALEDACERGELSWSSLVRERLRVMKHPVMKIAKYIMTHFIANLGVNYTEARLLHQFNAVPAISGHGDKRSLSEAVGILKVFYTDQLHSEDDTSDAHFDSTPHHLCMEPGAENGETMRRYYCLERRNALPAPFPLRGAPARVITLTIVPRAAQSGADSRFKFCLRYYERTLPRIHDGLEKVLRATVQSSSLEHPHDTSVVRDNLDITHALLPSFPRKKHGPRLVNRSDINVPLSKLKGLQRVNPEHSYIGGEELLSILRRGNDRRRLGIIFFHAGGDPMLSPLAWVALTMGLNEMSTLAYAFTADATYRRGYDVSVYGRDHLDYLIAVTLKSLRKYDTWRVAQGLDMTMSVGVRRMVEEAGIQEDDARRLHELLIRMAPDRGKGASVYVGNARYVGDAVPVEYRRDG